MLTENTQNSELILTPHCSLSSSFCRQSLSHRWRENFFPGGLCLCYISQIGTQLKRREKSLLPCALVIILNLWEQYDAPTSRQPLPIWWKWIVRLARCWQRGAARPIVLYRSEDEHCTLRTENVWPRNNSKGMFPPIIIQTMAALVYIEEDLMLLDIFIAKGLQDNFAPHLFLSSCQ